MADNLIKTLPIIKYKQFVKMIKIEDKKELLAFIKQKDNLRNIF